MKKCVICGKEFKPKIKTQVTCGAECREENARRQARDYYERHSSQHMKEEKRICVECGGLLFRKQRARSRAAVSAAKRGREKNRKSGQTRTRKNRKDRGYIKGYVRCVGRLSRRQAIGRCIAQLIAIKSTCIRKSTKLISKKKKRKPSKRSVAEER